ncbi:hypothetical protein TWF506_002467 [Arthrobotrys conoides]|uniref:Uncharacterized protein n=1 Tax=Arthrobotrys conoides TaxID=74498 RepID=A0AAN8RLR7_9PEZI
MELLFTRNQIIISFLISVVFISLLEAAALPGYSGYRDATKTLGNPDTPPGEISSYLHLKYNTRTCNLGFSTQVRSLEANQEGIWEGYPIGAYLTETPLPDDICYSTASLGSKFVNSISSLYLSGYCECKFFGDAECKDPLLMAYNTQQPNLGNVTKGNVGTGVNLEHKFNSFSCRWTNRTEIFESCSVNINNGAKEGRNEILGVLDNSGYVEQIETFHKTDMEAIQDTRYGTPTSGVTKCINVNSNIRVRAWEIYGCSCDFFDKPECEGTRIYQQGVPGKDRGRVEGEEVAPARSFRCWLPFGIAWGEEREDSVDILDPNQRATESLTTVMVAGLHEAMQATATLTTLSKFPMPSWIANAISWGEAHLNVAIKANQPRSRSSSLSSGRLGSSTARRTTPAIKASTIASKNTVTTTHISGATTTKALPIAPGVSTPTSVASPNRSRLPT